MERSYWLEPCEHPECDQPTPLEYCLVEADESYDDVEAIIEVMYEVINEIDSVSIDYGYSGDQDGALLHREFSCDVAPSSMLEFNGGTRVGIYLGVGYAKNPQRTIYTIQTDWRIAEEDYLSEKLIRTYKIEVYPGGVTHCTVTEPDYSPDMCAEAQPVIPANIQFVDRQMLPYDFREVRRALEQLLDIQYAEMV